MSAASLWILLIGGIVVFVAGAVWASVRALGGWPEFMREANNPRAEPRAKTSHYWYLCFAAVVGWVIVINPLGGDVSPVTVVIKLGFYAAIAAVAQRWARPRV